MKKTYSCADIIAIFNTLNNMKSRSDIIPGDAEIFWANTINLEEFSKASSNIQKVMDGIIDSHFTDNVCHIEKTESGEERKVLNEDSKDMVLSKLDIELDKINRKEMEIEIETIPKSSFEKMIKANEKSMSFLEMTVMQQFVEDSKTKDGTEDKIDKVEE